MIVKLASIVDTFKNIPAISNFAKKLSKDPHFVDKAKNLSLVGTIALGDAALKAANAKPGESKVKAFGHGALEGAFAGGLIAGGDMLIDSLKRSVK